ncbi:chemotaxis regulatory protein ChePep [Helicobacter pylori]|uniref:chemotaxis regulatory protein ChePep n=1 Tax=Helicobacter pylori TaxID=210 RepID=UPI000EAF7A01|nr:chemotaxis regulatory protein ChePep [Helicobacter pylori]
MKMILFNQNPMIAKLLESVSKKLELSIENFNHYQELSAHLKKDPEWLLIADDECLEKLDQVDWLELKETISQNKNSVCMYKKGNEAQPFLEGFEMKIKKPFLPTEMLKVLQKKLGSNISELEPSQNLDPTQEVLETNWDDLENLGDLEALAKEEPNNEEQLLPTLNTQEEAQEKEIKEEKQEVKETPQEEKPKDDETQEGETPKDEEVSKELETQEKLEIPKEETQKEVKEEIKEETQENKEEKQEETQDSPSAQELEAMQELVKEIQENSNGQENKEKTQESAEIPQDKEIQEVVTEKTQAQELEIPKEKTQESAEALQETQAQELEKQENAETPQEKEKQEDTGTPQELEIPQVQEKETPQEETQETQEKEMPQTQDEKPQEDHYESIEDIPEPVMAKAMGEELPFLNEAVAKIPNNENATETPKESDIKTPQEKEESDKTSSPLELRLNLQDLLKSLNQESLKSLLENKTLSIKITLEDKKPNA